MKLLTEGMMRIGWATPSFEAGKLLGSDSHSYAYDGHLVSDGTVLSIKCFVGVTYNVTYNVLYFL